MYQTTRDSSFVLDSRKLFKLANPHGAHKTTSHLPYLNCTQQLQLAVTLFSGTYVSLPGSLLSLAVVSNKKFCLSSI